MEYMIVIEKAQRNYAAYVPDLPGCVATGATRDDAIREIGAAMVMHIESLRENGDPVPAPQCTAAMVQVAA
ncbi:MAG: type II toxin-antitoxin system HicB family antitoxin [Boseongicola sp. SB0677_bin_26]|nr:type II toxin-antitoxin system HicB family antitoxin [Boseongicola sp. SB0677_bin_26]